MLSCGGISDSGVIVLTAQQRLKLLFGSVDNAAHINARNGHRQQTHRAQYTKAPAHIVGHDKALPAVGVGKSLEDTPVGISGSEDMLVRLVAVLLGQQLPEDAEGRRRLKGSTGFGDDIHVKIKPGERVERVAQSIGGQAVAHEEDSGVVLTAIGL